MKLLLILFLLTTSATAEELPTKLPKKVSIAQDAIPLFSAAALDFISTEYALNNGLIEFNPLGRKLEFRIALKVATNAGVLIIIRKLRDNDKHKAAVFVKYLIVAAQTTVAILNYDKARKHENLYRRRISTAN